MTTVTIEPQAMGYQNDFDSLDGSSPIHALRQRAFERFVESGFPTRRDEAWRFTDVRSIASTEFALADASEDVSLGQMRRFLFDESGCHRLVFVNGFFNEGLSSVGACPNGVRIESLANAIEQDAGVIEDYLARQTESGMDAFAELNTAFLRDGAFIFIPKNVVLESPVHVVHLYANDASPTVAHQRTLIVAEAGSQATVVETFASLGDESHLVTGVTEAFAGENATLRLERVNRLNTCARFIGRIEIQQQRSSTVVSHTVTLGGALVRNNFVGTMDGDGAHCALNGLTITRGSQHVDNHLRVEHNVPLCDSREFFKTILDDTSSGVFTGRIFVEEDAQKTDAKQTNQNLLLSDEAHVDTKPQLEIFADDVKCTHGATIGRLDEDAMFYLRSRGLNERAARSMLVYAFAAESLETMALAPLRKYLDSLILEQLPDGEAVAAGSPS